MILIKLWGGPGNQMFEYAAARLTAERLQCAILFDAPAFGLRRTLQRVIRPSSYCSLFDLYGDLHPGLRGHAVDVLGRLAPNVTARGLARLLPNEFKPAQPENSAIESNEIFDRRFFDISRRTRMYGYYQSARYFAGHENQVRFWFAPQPAEAAAVSAHWARCGLDPSKTLAVHVRLGDYRANRWALPRSYYDDALALLGENYPIALFSDEPELARQFLGRDVAFLSDGADIKRDLLLMASCRQIVIANSSFSWWAAWLNSAADKTVVAPKYHIGRRIGEWYPAGIEVEGWTYL
jgi:hypothetical protein